MTNDTGYQTCTFLAITKKNIPDCGLYDITRPA